MVKKESKSLIIAHDLSLQRTCDVTTNHKQEFHDFCLKDETLSGLKSAGFYQPSPIQAKAIPIGRMGVDLIVQAKSGTGKTCVFAVIALEGINLSFHAVQVLILAPTREIALQIYEVISAIGVHYKDLKVNCFIGGTSLETDKKNLESCQIAIGTPGRIMHLIKLEVMKTTNVRIFVLDEADKLVAKSFGNNDQINWIFSTMPKRKQILAISATYSADLQEYIKLYMESPKRVSLNPKNLSLLGLKQFYVTTKPAQYPSLQLNEKVIVISNLFKSSQFNQALVFCNSHYICDQLNTLLVRSGWPTTFISSHLTQDERIDAVNRLKNFRCRILISTDLTARGIDARNVDFVVNFDVPFSWETYLHRIGRAGRYGREGKAFTLVNPTSEGSRFCSIVEKCNLPIQLYPQSLYPDGYQHELKLVTDGTEEPVKPLSVDESRDDTLVNKDRLSSDTQMNEEVSLDLVTIDSNSEKVKELLRPNNEISIQSGRKTAKKSNKNKKIREKKRRTLKEDKPKSEVCQDDENLKICDINDLTADFDQYRINTYYLHMTSEDIGKDLKYMMDFNQPIKHDCDGCYEHNRNRNHVAHVDLSNLKSDSTSEFSSGSERSASSDSEGSPSSDSEGSASSDSERSASSDSEGSPSSDSEGSKSERSTSSSSKGSASLKQASTAKHRKNKIASEISDISNPFFKKIKYIPLPPTATPSPYCYHHHHLVMKPPPCVCLPHADVSHHLTHQLPSQPFNSSDKRNEMADFDQENSLNSLLQPPLQHHSRNLIFEQESFLVSEDHGNTSNQIHGKTQCAKLCENESSYSGRQQNPPKNLLLNIASSTTKLKAANLSSKVLKPDKTANMLLNDDKYADFVYNNALQHLLKHLK